jgi:hypothetical protein
MKMEMIRFWEELYELPNVENTVNFRNSMVI